MSQNFPFGNTFHDVKFFPKWLKLWGKLEKCKSARVIRMEVLKFNTKLHAFNYLESGGKQTEL